MVLTETGLAKVFQRIKSFIASQLNSKASAIHTHSDYVPRSGGAVMTGEALGRTVDNSFLSVRGGTDYNLGAYLQLYGKNHSTNGGQIMLVCRKSDGTAVQLTLQPDGTATWGNKNLAMKEDVVPRSGGAVITGSLLGRTVNNDQMNLSGGSGWGNGASILLAGKDYTVEAPSLKGCIRLVTNDGTTVKTMHLFPDGTWTWDGTACQITSDQRLKQQIAEIDDKLLDAWGDVELSQFKYNDAVNEKGDNARLHTGYVVQQIESACKSHDVDISEYGLYCHEEYPEETEEVEVTQEDGTIKKETKVIREASEHYSLRYTEIYAIECAYLRRENSRLKENLASLEERLEKLEKAENSENQEK